MPQKLVQTAADYEVSATRTARGRRFPLQSTPEAGPLSGGFFTNTNILHVGLALATRDLVGLTPFLERKLATTREPLLMGVVNTTPDSFYDGGKYVDPERAIELVDRLIGDGADIVDVGAESTRPGSTGVPADEQIRRLEPALRHAVARGVVVSVDTTLADVARHALSLGAHIVNDVSCLADPELARAAAERGAVLVLMHSREPMSTLRGYSEYPDDAYRDVVADVLSEWRAARDRAVSVGVPASRVWLDPGLGFAKNARQSFDLLRRLDVFTSEGVPVVVGPSRKSFITLVDAAPPAERLGGTIAACLHATDRGARVLRVHDVREVRQALAVTVAARTQWEALHAG